MLNQEIAAFMSALNLEQKGLDVPLFSLRKNSAKKSPQIAENFAPVIPPLIPLVFKSWKTGCSVSLR